MSFRTGDRVKLKGKSGQEMVVEYAENWILGKTIIGGLINCIWENPKGGFSRWYFHIDTLEKIKPKGE